MWYSKMYSEMPSYGRIYKCNKLFWMTAIYLFFQRTTAHILYVQYILATCNKPKGQHSFLCSWEFSLHLSHVIVNRSWVQSDVKMYSVQLDKRINQITSIFYRLGLWHREDEPTIKETRLKLFYSVYYLLLPTSSMAGALTSDNKNDCIFLVQVTMATAVLSVKLMYIIWRKKEILDLLNRNCVYSIEGHDQFNLVNNKLKILMKFTTIFISICWLFAACSVLVVPFFGCEKSLYLKVAFPLDWRNNEVAYWITFAFVLTETVVTEISVLLGAIIWYLVLNCALRYQVLGHKIKNMGIIRREEEVAAKKRKISVAEKEKGFLMDLFTAIESYKHINEYYNLISECKILNFHIGQG